MFLDKSNDHLIENTTTIVSAFFDLATRENNNQRVNADNYLKSAEYILDLDVNLVLYIEPAFVQFCKERRKDKQHKTEIYELRFEDLYYYKYIETVTNNSKKNPIYAACSYKDTPNYMIVTWSKLNLLHQTILKNPFNTTHFAWLDFGITHVADITYIEEDKIFENIPDKIRILMLKPFRDDDFKNRQYYYTHRFGHIGAGYITGSKESFVKFYEIFDNELQAVLTEGYGPSEEQIYPLLCNKFPELFEFYYGDYRDILSNYKIFRTDLYEINNIQLSYCLTSRNYSKCCEICEFVFPSIKQNLFNKSTKFPLNESMRNVAAFLNYYYTGAYYNFYPNQDKAKEIVEYYAELIKINQEFRDIFIDARHFIRPNFSFINDRSKIGIIYDDSLTLNIKDDKDDKDNIEVATESLSQLSLQSSLTREISVNDEDETTPSSSSLTLEKPVKVKDNNKRNKIAIGVMVTTVNKKYRDQLKGCVNTWIDTAKKHNVPVFLLAGNGLSDEFDLVNLPGVKEDYQSAFFKQFTGLKYMKDNCDSEFYMIVGTDNYVNIPNLLQLLDKYDSKNDLYIGGHGDSRTIDNRSIYFHSGGAGFILTKSVVEKLDTNFNLDNIYVQWEKILSRNNEVYLLVACDVAIAYFCELIGITATKEINFYSCNYYGRCYTDTVKCCSRQDINIDTIISCHYMDPQNLYEYHTYLTTSIESYSRQFDEINDKWTLVTCLYDLGKYNDSPGKGLENYKKHGQFLLSLPINLVIFCDPEEEEYFKQERAKHGYLSKTKIFSIPFDQFPYYSYKDRIVENRKINKINDGRNTYLYFVLVSSKFFMIDTIINHNPFKSEYFGWIDFGVGHTVGRFTHQIVRSLQVYREKCSFCYINYTPEHIMKNNKDYYYFGRCGTACGFFTGNKNNMKQLCDNFNKKWIETVESGFGHAEEQIIPLLYIENPDIFEFYFGDYVDLFANYDMMRGNPLTTLKYLIPRLRENNKHKLSFEACSKLYNSYEQSFTYFDIKDLVRCLDEYFIASYYLGKIGLCIDICNKHLYYEKEFGLPYVQSFRENGNTYISNTNFVFHHLPKKSNIAIYTDDIDDSRIKDHLSKGDRVFVYGKFELTTQSIISANPIIRPVEYYYITNYSVTYK
jgi:hypothetical protein